MSDGFYKTTGWFRARSKAIAKWKASGLPCAVCGEPLLWQIKGSVIVDHIVNRKKRPDLALDPANLQITHHACNTRKAAWVENSTKVEVGLDGFPRGW